MIAHSSGLSRLDLQPRFASLSRKIRAVALLGHDAFEAHLLYRLEEGRAFFDRFAHAIGGILSDRILQATRAAASAAR